MRLPDNNTNTTPRLSAGEEFVKKIGLLGAILFLLFSILGTLLMIYANRVESPAEPEPVEPYSSTYFFPKEKS